MRSRYLTTAIAMFVVASCGGDGYGSGYGDDEESQDDHSSASGDAGAWDARVKDAGAAKPDGGAWDAAGGREGATKNEDDDNDSTPDGGSGRDPGGDSCATLSYQTFGKQFLTDYCVSCHGGAAPTGGFKLDTLAALTSRKAGVKKQVLSGGMPMGDKKPSGSERARLGQWIDCGAK